MIDTHTTHNRYVSKCTAYVTYNIDVKKWLRLAKDKKSTKGDVVASMITAGNTLQQIFTAHPGYTLIHKRPIECMMATAAQWAYNEVRDQWVSPSLLDARTPDQGDIIGWLLDNVRKSRVFKQPALWIWGPPNMGKTSLLNWLDSTLKIYWIPHVCSVILSPWLIDCLYLYLV